MNTLSGATFLYTCTTEQPRSSSIISSTVFPGGTRMIGVLTLQVDAVLINGLWQPLLLIKMLLERTSQNTLRTQYWQQRRRSVVDGVAMAVLMIGHVMKRSSQGRLCPEIIVSKRNQIIEAVIGLISVCRLMNSWSSELMSYSFNEQLEH